DRLSPSDPGGRAFDHPHNLRPPTLRLFAERGALVTFFDGAATLGRAFSTGVASITPVPLIDGVHQISATVEDAAGNLSSRTPPLVLTIDTLAPAVPLFALRPSHQRPVRGAARTT